jgi:predicted glycoside hydrolase/deacetylase ChbG (UPF0249 family)
VAERRLIINADDLGLSRSINEGIRECVDKGVVTSASLMVRWPAAVDAARWAHSQNELSLGLHLDLGEWVCVDGEWSELYRVADRTDVEAVNKEVDAQLEAFINMAGRLPSHIDSHQHAHNEEPVRTVLLQRAARLGIAVRGHSVAYSGRFYGQWGGGHPYPDGIGFEALLNILDDLPMGTTELGCHPGTGASDFESMYISERAVEKDVLCDPRLPGELALRSIELTSYAAQG